MPVMGIPFGEWLPAQPTFKNPGCEVADNVIPVPGGYGPFPGLVASGDTISDDVRGSQQFFDNAGNSLILGGTDDSLFIRRTTVSETSGLTSIGENEAWDFCRFNDFAIATANANAPQYLTDIDSDNTWSALPGSPPLAKRCARVGDFVMFGSVDSIPNRIQWSAFNNPAGDWTPSRLTQAGFADLASDRGEVQRIVGGRYALVFQERAISRLSYVGPPRVWQRDDVTTDRGTIAPFSVVQVGYLTFYLSQDGFRVTNGSADQPIGTNRVNRWFFETANQADLRDVQGAIDWQNEAIVWAFNQSASDGYDRLLIYSWAQDRWSSATVSTGWIVASAIDGLSIDDLDAIYGDLDSIPLSIDSDEFKAKDRRLAAFVNSDTTASYETFTGNPLVAQWETGSFQPAPSQRVFVSEVTPLIDPDSWDMTVTLISTDNLNADTTFGPSAVGRAGFASVRAEGQKMAVRVSKPSGAWSDAQGVQVRYEPAGYV